MLHTHIIRQLYKKQITILKALFFYHDIRLDLFLLFLNLTQNYTQNWGGWAVVVAGGCVWWVFGWRA